MGSISSWNIRGLNWPNKQEDLKIFLHTHRIDFIGLLETKIKLAKVEAIAQNLFMGWRWLHNFDTGDHGRILLAWKPGRYHVNLLSKTPQSVHCRVEDLSLSSSFLITFVYGYNQESGRVALWETLCDLAENMDEPWCILRDFNSVLYAGDRIGGTPVLASELHGLSDTIRDCGLSEPPYSGLYFSWTSKTVWSRID